RDFHVTGVQTCALPISEARRDLALARDRSFVGKLSPGADPVIGRNAPWRIVLLLNRVAKYVLVHGQTCDCTVLSLGCLGSNLRRDRKSTRLNSSHVKTS